VADKNIRLLHQIKIPAIIAECGFLSNDNEAKLLSSEQYRNKIAYLIATSVMQFLSK
jgi:N-acetylmuramoyl-L-alanine amidase